MPETTVERCATGTPTPARMVSATRTTAVAGSAPSVRVDGVSATTRALTAARALVSEMTVLAGWVTDSAAWSQEDRRALLADLDRAVDGLGAVRAAVLVAERDAGTWRGGGDRSFEAWRSRVSGAGPRAAAAQVRQAEHLDAAPAAAAAVTTGRVGLEHAAVLARVAGSGTPAQQAALAVPAVQEALLTIAQRQDAGTFATTVARWAATVDPDGLERDHGAQRAQRFLHVTQSSAGTFLKGRLDTIAGHRLTLALEALSPRPGTDDDRDPGQRRADALDAMAGRILAAADTKPGGHVPPQITMVMTPETWAAARAERDRRRRSGADATSPTLLAAPPSSGPSYPPAELEDGTPVPVSEVARAMCDCDITRVVLDADGVPVDLGRTQRLYTGPQRKAVIARDRECGWPGCHAPARWCEIHHLAWWDRDDGRTSVDNAVLLCSFHHHETHRRDLTLSRHPGAGPGGSPPAGGGTTESTGPPRTVIRPDPGRAPTSSGPSGALPRVHYRVRDRTGRPVGKSPTVARSALPARPELPAFPASAALTQGVHHPGVRVRPAREPGR